MSTLTPFISTIMPEGPPLMPSAQHLQLIMEPANRFLLLCALNLRYPDNGELARHFQRGRAAICDAVREEIQHLHEIEGNYRFCTMDLVNENIFQREKQRFSGVDSFGRTCETWLRSNSISIDQRRLA
jgi:hypothetical protein